MKERKDRRWIRKYEWRINNEWWWMTWWIKEERMNKRGKEGWMDEVKKGWKDEWMSEWMGV